MKITVTQDDIDKGRPGFLCFCPVAIACKRAGLEEPAVNPDFIMHGERGSVHRHLSQMPNSAVDFVRRFDYGNTVHPFEFELEV